MYEHMCIDQNYMLSSNLSINYVYDNFFDRLVAVKVLQITKTRFGHEDDQMTFVEHENPILHQKLGL